MATAGSLNPARSMKYPSATPTTTARKHGLHLPCSVQRSQGSTPALTVRPGSCPVAGLASTPIPHDGHVTRVVVDSGLVDMATRLLAPWLAGFK